MALIFNPNSLAFEPMPEVELSEAAQKRHLRWVPESQLLAGAFKGMTAAQLRRHLGALPRYMRDGTWPGARLQPHYEIDDVLKSRET